MAALSDSARSLLTYHVYETLAFSDRADALTTEVDSFAAEDADVQWAGDSLVSTKLLAAEGFVTFTVERATRVVRLTQAALDWFDAEVAAGRMHSVADEEAARNEDYAAEAESERAAEMACERYYEERGEAHYENFYNGY
jgi:hypothetical protein